MRRLLLVATVALAGCDVVFGTSTSTSSDSGVDAVDAVDAAIDGPGPKLCLEERFDGTMIDPAVWELSKGTYVHVSQANMRLQIDIDGRTQPGPYDASVLQTTVPFDLTDGFAGIEVVKSVSTPATENFFFVNNAAGTGYVMSVGNGTLNFNGARAPIAYDAVAHRRWRIGHHLPEDNVTYETSPDGNDWTVHATVAVGVNPRQLYIRIGAGSFMNVQHSATDAVYDNVLVYGPNCQP